MTSEVILAVLVGGGLALLVSGLLARGRQRDRDLAAVLDLPWGERDVPVTAVTERPWSVVGSVTRVTDRAVARVDRQAALAGALETSGIPLMVGEYVACTVAGAIAGALLLTLVTASWIIGAAGAIAVAYGAAIAPRVAAARRRRRIEAQLPDALATIGASLESGHTFLRSIQMYAEECQPPLAGELARLVQSTAVGEPLLDALDRMAARLRIRDLDWVVHAIRIQQSTGGRLADVLGTLADFMRAREEVRREVKALTAEGRMSAAILGATPPVLFVVFEAINPGYSDPLLEGWGLVALVGAALSTALGVGVILRMVRIEV